MSARDFLRGSALRLGWDTRTRNRAVARAVSTLLARCPASPRRVLDVGCGEAGLAPFLPGVRVDGADLAPGRRAGRTVHVADARALPFADRAFAVVACVDVLEHLTPADRTLVLREVVRVARVGAVVACPDGATARAADEALRAGLLARGRPAPGWLDEHLRQPYPEAGWLGASLGDTARALGRVATVELAWNEPLVVTRLVRAAALRSNLLYTVGNLACGLLGGGLEHGPGARYRVVAAMELEA